MTKSVAVVASTSKSSKRTTASTTVIAKKVTSKSNTVGSPLEIAVATVTTVVVRGDTRPKSKLLATPIVGAHVNGGIKGAVPKALEIGAQTIQIFLGSPQMWRQPNPGQQEVQAFMSGVREHKLGPVFVHGNYLVNLAAASPDNLRKSIENLRINLFMADSIGATGVIFHPGSAGQAPYADALAKVVSSLEEVLDGYSGNCKLLLEVCAGQGQTIGDKFSEFADIMSAMEHDQRLGVCWDTCHLFAAGYDIASARGLRSTMNEFEKFVGFEWLYAIHANDSKAPLGSRRDRHENIGQGHIGEAAFARMWQEPELRRVPWILEVPGLEKKGPDRSNIDLLKTLAG
ncbi:MAG TPA: deoxyribonuclease IV [Planktothrix sp.]